MASNTLDLAVTVQEVQPWSRRLTITVPAARVQRARDSVTSRLAQNVRVPGFRKGKLPPRIIEQRFGPAVDQETLDRTIQEAYREALEAEGLTPITQGQVENVQYERGSDLVFEVHFEVRPEIELPRVSGFTVTRSQMEVGDIEVDAVLEQLREERAVWHPVEEEVQPDYGDEVTVEITAQTAEGEPEEPRTYRFALGEGQAIPMVEEAILSLRLGQEGDFTVRFPDDFPDEARRGEEQQLHIQLNEIRRKALPEIDDELARSVGDFEDLPALRARVLEDLQRDAEIRAEGEVRGQLLERILEANPIEVPESMIERYLDHVTRRAERPDEKDLAPEERERVERLRESLRPQAEWTIKRMLVVEKLAEREGLYATQDEIDARVEELATRHNRSQSEVWLQLEKSGELETLEREITEEKVFGHLKSLNTIA
jgi:trigger factor